MLEGGAIGSGMMGSVGQRIQAIIVAMVASVLDEYSVQLPIFVTQCAVTVRV